MYVVFHFVSENVFFFRAVKIKIHLNFNTAFLSIGKRTQMVLRVCQTSKFPVIFEKMTKKNTEVFINIVIKTLHFSCLKLLFLN